MLKDYIFHVILIGKGNHLYNITPFMIYYAGIMLELKGGSEKLLYIMVSICKALDLKLLKLFIKISNAFQLEL